MPAQAAGLAGVDELVIHGWDIAVATEQSVPLDDPALLPAMEAAHGFAREVVDSSPEGTPGLFGPPIPVADDAPLADTLLGLTGRDPSWRPDHR